MPASRFLLLLGCALAAIGGATALALPAFAPVLALPVALSAAMALVAALVDHRRAPPTQPEAENPLVVASASASATSERPDSASELLAELERHKLLENQLMLAKQEAEAATMAKGEFLATMSHEIRTPLNGIIPLLDLVLATDLSPDQRDYLTTAFGSARELLRIVDDILDYSKLDAQKLQLENVGINLRELSTLVIRLLEKGAEAKGLRLELEIDPAVRLAVRGDPVRLRQVLTNLISNAIKFTQRGSVDLRISRIGETRTRNQLRFEVRDTGVGIAPEVAAQLFQPFVQADASTTRTFGGTGLGLAICKRIVTLMGGRIGVDSIPGKGSVFWFEVALDKPLGDIEGPALVHAKDLRVLLVTANARQQQRFGTALKHWGMPFVQVSNTQDALGRLRSLQRPGQRGFDLVLVDVASIPTTALALHRALMRETRAEDTLRVYLGSAGDLPAELESTPGFHLLPRESADEELHARLLALLDAPPEDRTAAARTTTPTAASPPTAMPPRAAPKPQPAEVARSAAVPDPASISPPAPPILRVVPGAPAPVVGQKPAIVKQPSMPVDPAPRVPSGELEHTVLLVEDNPVNRHVAQRLLNLAGIRFDSAENGSEALDKMNSGTYGAVLMDCQMPIMDGYTATRKRRQFEQEQGLPRLPIIAMTANAMLGDREKCLDAGMDDYMSKPLSRALLETTLQTWLAQRPGPRPEAVPTPAVPAAPAPPTTPPPLVVTASGPALDREVLRELREIMGAEFVSLVQVFLEDAPLALERIRTLATGPELAAIAAPAHTLKSTSANLGALRLSGMAKSMELEARQNTLRAAPARAAALAAEFERVAAELRQEIGN